MFKKFILSHLQSKSYGSVVMSVPSWNNELLLTTLAYNLMAFKKARYNHTTTFKEVHHCLNSSHLISRINLYQPVAPTTTIMRCLEQLIKIHTWKSAIRDHCLLLQQICGWSQCLQDALVHHSYTATEETILIWGSHLVTTDQNWTPFSANVFVSSCQTNNTASTFSVE